MSQSITCTEAPSFSLVAEKVRQYCRDGLEIDGELHGLSDTKDTSFVMRIGQELKTAFSDDLALIKEAIDDRTCGIAAIDIPSVYEDPTDDAIAGALTSIALTSILIDPTIDVENHTPFTMFSASHESNEALNKAGLLNISPTDILDFHSDGLVRGRSLGVPRYVAIYNTFINYRRCGSFYWVPSFKIDSMMEHVEHIGFDHDFTFDLTPAIYGESGSQVENVFERKVKTAIFKDEGDGNIVTFMYL